MSIVSAATLAAEGKLIPGARQIIKRFTFRRIVLSASIFGLIAAVESIAQAIGIIAAYPNVAERTRFIYDLAGNTALGLFYGDSHVDIVSPGGYMVYRILPIIALVLAIWGLMFTTKMLRGQEESGRWELLLAGKTSARRATTDTMIGAAGGVVIAYIINIVVLILAGKNPKLALSLDGCLLYGLALIAGPAIAIGVGAVASQLAATKRRANLYGLSFLMVFFLIRSVGNTVSGLAWLKNLTPFGWIDKIHPFTHSAPIWLLPLLAVTLIGCGLAIWLAGKRDMGESFIADSDDAKPKLTLLGSQPGFAFRQTRGILSGWLIAGIALSAMTAGIDKSVAKSLVGAGGLTKTISKLTGNPYSHIEIAYLSVAGYMVLIVLMLVVTTGINAIRDEEASGRLDNFMSGTVSRKYWLGMRLLLLISAATAITLISNILVLILAEAQGIHVSAATLLLGGFNILGPVIFLLGAGTLMFALLPRIATIAMYLLIAWSFTIDIIAAAVKASKYLADTSLLHHIALVPAAQPKWSTFAAITALGLAMAVAGIFVFQNRDLEAE